MPYSGQMTNIVLGDAWDDTRAFIRREHALIIPVALMTLGFGTLLGNFAMPAGPNGQLVAGPWMWLLLPYALFSLVGTLALSELALTSGVSVGEALRVAFLALPRALAASVLTMLAGAMLVAVGKLLFLALGYSPQQATGVTIMLFALIALMVSAQLSLVPALIVHGSGPLAALGRSWSLMRPVRGRIILLTIAYLLTFLLFAFAVQVAAGSLFLLLARMVALPTLGVRLTELAVTFATATFQTGLVIFSAQLYRRLAGNR